MSDQIDKELDRVQHVAALVEVLQGAERFLVLVEDEDGWFSNYRGTSAELLWHLEVVKKELLDSD